MAAKRKKAKKGFKKTGAKKRVLKKTVSRKKSAPNKPFVFIDHVGEAGFEAFGKNPRELFEHCALAMFETMADTNQLKGDKHRTFGLHAKTLEELLHRFLNELAYIKDAKRRIWKSVKVRIRRQKHGLVLLAKASGDEAETTSGKIMRTDVKAVTWHEFALKTSPKGLKARVVLDI